MCVNTRQCVVPKGGSVAGRQAAREARWIPPRLRAGLEASGQRCIH